MWQRSKRYLRENWGAPFVLAFIVLLIASALLLSEGQTSSANSIAVYAFYALVLGVVLQIASYIKYGESGSKHEGASYTPPSAPLVRIRPGRRTLAVILVVIIVIAGGLGAYYYKQPSHQTGTTTSTTTTHTTIGLLSLGIDFVKELPLPNNGVQILVGVNQTGGLQPYNFTAYWSDGVNQSNDIGVFIRSFPANQSIPSNVKIVVESSNGQTATVLASIPGVNRTITTTSETTTTSSTTSSEFPLITFKESGLPDGSLWSVTLIPTSATFKSNTTKIAFDYPSGSALNYSISGPYDMREFSWAYVASPRSGAVEVNGSEIQINIVFSNQSITAPQNHLFVMNSIPVATSTGGNSEQLNVTYVNTFPDQAEAIVFAMVRNIATGSVSIETATISPLGSSTQTASLNFLGLSPGDYSASFYVASASGLQLSQTTNSTFVVKG